MVVFVLVSLSAVSHYDLLEQSGRHQHSADVVYLDRATNLVMDRIRVPPKNAVDKCRKLHGQKRKQG